jgi:trigger factor
MSHTHNHDHGHSHEYTATVEKKGNGEVEITVVVPAETLASHRKYALESIGENAVLDGFRKGKIPEKILVEKVGEMAILTEAAEITVSHLYPHIIEEQKLSPIGSPSVTMKKLAPGNPLEFVLTVTLMPEFDLPDFKAIAKKANAEKISIDVTDKDVEAALERILRQKMAYERIQAKAQKKKDAEDAGLTLPTPETAEDTEEDYSKLPLPELTDDVAKTLGNFQTKEECLAEIRKHLGSEKEKEVVGKRRGAIIDGIVDATKVTLPPLLIDSEIAQMFGEMESDITRAGLAMNDYLEHIKKTREDLKKEWTPSAEKRVKLQLVLSEIAKQEKITPDIEAMKHEVAAIKAQFPDADEERVSVYVASTLQNEATLKMLETIA